MTIIAKFPGSCLVCRQPVQVGDRVEWEKSKGVTHERCDKSASRPSPASPSPAGAFAPTKEQAHALELFRGGGSLAIEAGAGTGKTSTLLLLAQAAPKLRGQYMAFNRAIVTEAREKMPATVNSSTAHSLAYKAWGHKYGHRLRGSQRMKSMDIANYLGIDPCNIIDPMGKRKQLGRSQLGGLALASVIRFCQTADEEPGDHHVPYVEGIDSMNAPHGGRSYEANKVVRRHLREAIAKAWADLLSEDGKLPYRHDHYLKAWQLSRPKINVDYILFDEAQDANPVMQAIVSGQAEHSQLVWVGDSQQQIYSFTGAINALAQVPADQRAFLTQSFRFGPDIAAVANEILGWLSADLRISGLESMDSTVGPDANPDAILTRTNAVAVSTVLRLQEEGQEVALVGGGAEVVRFARAADELMKLGRTEHPDLACFESWSEVESYVQEDQLGQELQLMVRLVNEFGVPAILTALDKTIREEDADVIVSTAHKAKGREWLSVQLAGDFPPEDPSDEELRLLYVACTRARQNLDIASVAVLGDLAEGVPA